MNVKSRFYLKNYKFINYATTVVELATTITTIIQRREERGQRGGMQVSSCSYSTIVQKS